MKTVIGITGVKQAGKSTSADIIKEYFKERNGIATEVALADKLKNACAQAFGLAREIFDDQRYKELPFAMFGASHCLQIKQIKSVLEVFNIDFNQVEWKIREAELFNLKMNSARHVAQIIGTQLLRVVGDEDIHCNSVNLNDGCTIISDIRFPNELSFFQNKKDCNFIPLYIHRTVAEDEVNEDSHISEKLIFEFRDNCIKIDNNKTMDSLKQLIHTTLDKYKLFK